MTRKRQGGRNRLRLKKRTPIVPLGTTGKAISLRVQRPRANAGRVVKQNEKPRSPDRIMRRPCADREEKRANREERDEKTRNEHLAHNHPERRRLQAWGGVDLAIEREF